MHAHGTQHTSRVLQISLGLTLAYIVVTAVAGVRAHSLALLSEAGHNLSDFLALLLSWVAVYVETRPPNSRKTYGYRRAGVLAAFLNAITLVAIAFLIIYEAFRRRSAPVEVHAQVMIWVAAAGVAMNGAIAFLLYGTARDVNVRSAFLHMLGDTFSTAAVIVGGGAILLTGQRWIDPALSVGIGALILWSSFGILRETVNILLEGTPRGMELDRISAAIRAVPGVMDVHDLHVWSLGSESHALSSHIRIADIPPSESDAILRRVNDMLGERFHIHHTTVQFEHVVCEIAHGCVVPVAEEPAHSHHEGKAHSR